MKKIITLIAAMLIAVGVNAKHVVDISSKFTAGEVTNFGNWEWKGVSVHEGDVNPETADDAGTTYFDASSYDYVCIKYRQCTIESSFIIQYNSKGTVGQYGPDFNDASATITANTSGLVGIQLSDLKNKVYSVNVQIHGPSGSMIIDEIFFATTAEYNEALAENPVTKDVAPIKEIDFSGATSFNDWGFNGVWATGDLTDYDYLVFEVEDLNVAGWGQWCLFDKNLALYANSGSFVQVIDITGYNRDLTNAEIYQYTGMNLGIQCGSGSSVTWKKVYFATAAYIQENDIKSHAVYGDTQEFSLSNFGVWDISGTDPKEYKGTFDASTGKFDITYEEGGGGGWWLSGTGLDLSHFDNIVIELAAEPASSAGKVVVEYADPSAAPAMRRAAANTEKEFYTGATCIVLPLDATAKNAVKQFYLAGAKDASYTITKAYAAVASATPTENLGTAPTTDTWTVAGTGAIFGSTWSETDTNNDMTANSAGTEFTLVKTGVTLEKGTTYEFKVVKNHDWSVAYPSTNYTFTVDKTGIYDVTVIFSPENEAVSHNAEYKGEAGPVTHTYSVIGTIVGNWDTDTDMTKGTDGLYTATFTDVAADTYKFKVRVDHDWGVAYPSSDYELTVADNGSTVTITFNEETKEVNATVTPATGISNITAEDATSAPMYNLSGQRVDASYKGVVIKNGRKMIQK